MHIGNVVGKAGLAASFLLIPFNAPGLYAKFVSGSLLSSGTYLKAAKDIAAYSFNFWKKNIVGGVSVVALSATSSYFCYHELTKIQEKRLSDWLKKAKNFEKSLLIPDNLKNKIDTDPNFPKKVCQISGNTIRCPVFLIRKSPHNPEEMRRIYFEESVTFSILFKDKQDGVFPLNRASVGLREPFEAKDLYLDHTLSHKIEERLSSYSNPAG